MKAVFGTVVCSAALLVGGVGLTYAAPQSTTATTTTTARKSSSKALDARISHKLNADPSLKRYDIKVKTDGSVATLTGTVPTEADRSKATAIAKAEGATRVDNQIIVDLNASTRGTTGTVERGVDKGATKTEHGIEKGAEKTSEGIEKGKEGTKSAYEKSKSAGMKAAEKTEGAVEKGVSKGAEGTAKGLEKAAEAVGKAGDAMSDGVITGHVKTRLADEDLLKGSDIHVSTDDRVVTLTGTVPSAGARARAVSVAKSTGGVSSVVDKLVIGSKKD